MSGITQDWRCWCSSLVVGSVLIASLQERVFAQIAPDNTLPNNSSITRDGNTFNINGGTQAGGNLFHSFSEFSVPTGGIASFNNAVDIQNIISRVTGGSASNIDGSIRALGTANLFLINPNGIIFGPNARLDIGGSFLATTADAMRFGDRGFFSASNPESSSSVLTVNPSALLFNQIKTASIQNNSVAPSGLNPSSEFTATGLRVPDGNSLLLVGGDINMDGGGLFAFGGRVELGGLAAPGNIGLSVNDFNLRLSYPVGVERADVSLSDGALVDVIAGGGGSIAVNARNLIAEGSIFRAGIGTGLGNTDAQAGDIEIDASDTVFSLSSIVNGVLGTGNAGNILIKTGSLNIIGTGSLNIIGNGISQIASITSITNGQGNAGSVTIQATDTVTISGIGSGVSSLVGLTGVGNGSDVNIFARSLSLSDGAQVSTSTLGTGNAGNIQINLDDGMSVKNNSIVQAATFGKGNAGNVVLKAGGAISFEGISGVLTSVARVTVLGFEFVGEGKGGDIDINANSVSVTDGAQLVSRSAGKGNAGNIEINASDFVNVSGTSSTTGGSSALFTFTDSNSTGFGGDIIVNTLSLHVSDGAVLDARTINNRNGGNITLNVGQAEIFNGGQLLSISSGSGNAGKITLNATDRVIINGSDRTYNDRLAQFGTNVAPINPNSGLFVLSQASGEAGNIEVASPQIRLDNTASISAESASGDGGNIILLAGDLLLLRRRSQISATAGTDGAGGDGGNININTPLGFIIATPNENSDITANAFTGSGGRITVQATGIYGIAPLNREDLQRLSPDLDPSQIPTNDITAISQTNPTLSGTVELNTPEVDPNSGLVELPTIPVDTEVAQGCYSPDYAQSSFVNVGRGGLPPNPKDVLTPDAALLNWVSLQPSNNNHSLPPVTNKPTTSTPKRIVEATGATLNNKGQIVLTANSSTANPYSDSQTLTSCGG